VRRSTQTARRELYLTRHTAQYYSVGTQNILYSLGDTTNSVRVIYRRQPRQIEFRATAVVITIIVSCASRRKGDKRIRRRNLTARCRQIRLDFNWKSARTGVEINNGAKPGQRQLNTVDAEKLVYGVPGPVPPRARPTPQSTAMFVRSFSWRISPSTNKLPSRVL
jgi:hypothetical protein